MNFMTSHKVGDTVFVPFWVVLEYYDVTPPDPFVKGLILNTYHKNTINEDAQATVEVCDLGLGKSNLIAYSVPVSYLIRRAELSHWINSISDWFKNYKITD